MIVPRGWHLRVGDAAGSLASDAQPVVHLRPAPSRLSLKPSAVERAWHISEQLLRRIVKRFQGGLAFEAYRLLHPSTLGSRAIKRRKKGSPAPRPLNPQPQTLFSRTSMARIRKSRPDSSLGLPVPEGSHANHNPVHLPNEEGTTLKKYQDLSPKMARTKARIWPWLSYMCRNHSTAVQEAVLHLIVTAWFTWLSI